MPTKKKTTPVKEVLDKALAPQKEETPACEALPIRRIRSANEVFDFLAEASRLDGNYLVSPVEVQVGVVCSP
jgi:hypothetical protein